MPTYEYECGDCGHFFERFQSMTARRIRTCPACRKRTVKRLIGTGAGLIFKGSGFYSTDYRSESYKKGAEKDKKSSSSDKTSDKSSDKASDKSSDKTSDKSKTSDSKSSAESA